MMGRTSKSRFSISVITTGAGIASREYLMGVFKYANTRTRWTFEFHNSVDEFSASHKHASSIDGILSIVPHTPASLSFIARKNIPTVIIDSRPKRQTLVSSSERRRSWKICRRASDLTRRIQFIRLHNRYAGDKIPASARGGIPSGH